MENSYLDLNRQAVQEIQNTPLTPGEVIGRGSNSVVRVIGQTQSGVGLVWIYGGNPNRINATAFFERLAWLAYFYEKIDERYRAFFPAFYFALIQDKSFIGFGTERFISRAGDQDIVNYKAGDQEAANLHGALNDCGFDYQKGDIATSLFETQLGPKLGDFEFLVSFMNQAGKWNWDDEKKKSESEYGRILDHIERTKLDFAVRVNNFV